MTVQPAGSDFGAAAADQAASDLAPPLPTATASTPDDPAPAIDHPDDHHADRVTAVDITEFLHHLACLRSPASGTDPADRAALLARKTELFTRIADQHAATTGQPPPTTPPPTTPTTPEGRTS